MTTAAKLGLQACDDGRLLDALDGVCDVFLTVDKSIPWQQRLDQRPFGVVLMRAKSNRLESLLPLVPRVLDVIDRLQAGEAHTIAIADPTPDQVP